MLITIVIPVFDEEELIHELYARTTNALNKITAEWEVICVNDGSGDSSLQQLLLLNATEPRWKIIDLSKNFGQQKAIWAGLHFATGKYVGIMDADLQDAPENFQLFLNELTNGYDVVYAIRTGRKENFLKRAAYNGFYRFLKTILSANVPADSGDFCLMNTVVLQKILSMPEQSLFIRGLRSWVGFRQIGILCEREKRFAGKSKYSFKKLKHLAYNGVFGFSDVPLKFLGRLGLYIILGSIIYTVWIITKKFIWGDVPEGFTTIVLVIMFFGGVQLITVRILGEYIHRIYEESRRRPLFIIKSKYGNLPQNPQQ